MTDHDLILRLIHKDEEAFRFLVQQWQDKVYNTSIGILQQAEEAEEITQDVFIEVFHSIQYFDQRSSLSTWLYRVAVNKSLDKLRYNQRKKRGGILARLFNKQDELVIDAPDFVHPGVQLEQKELSAVLFKAIDQLPEKQKAAFILHHTEGLTYKEIAEVLETSLSSVESLLFRAKENLRKLLHEYYSKNF